jgi:hypothetical protein
MIAVLDWVLTGKGGWTTVYTGTNLRAYRSLTGNRFYLRVDDTSAVGARLRGYRNMTAISTGTSIFPTTAQGGGSYNNWGVRKNTPSNPTGSARRYWGIRTNTYFFMVVEASEHAPGPPENWPYDGGGYRGVTGFGDIPSLCEADSHCSVVIGEDFISNTYPYFLSTQFKAQSIGHGDPLYHAVKFAFSGNPSGAVVSPTSEAYLPFASTVGTTRVASDQMGRIAFQNPTILTASDAASGTAGTMIRARLPNVHHVFGPVSSSESAGQLIADQEVVTIGSRDFVALQHIASASAQSGILLEKTDTDGVL